MPRHRKNPSSPWDNSPTPRVREQATRVHLGFLPKATLTNKCIIFAAPKGVQSVLPGRSGLGGSQVKSHQPMRLPGLLEEVSKCRIAQGTVESDGSFLGVQITRAEPGLPTVFMGGMHERAADPGAAKSTVDSNSADFGVGVSRVESVDSQCSDHIVAG